MSEALNELTSLREARQRTEDMVIGLIQQRDMYKAMMEELQQNQILLSKGQNYEPSFLSPTTASGTGQRELVLFSPQTHGTAPTPGTTALQTAAGSGATHTPSSAKLLKSVNIQDLQLRITIIEEENRRLKDRAIRIDELESMLNTTIDALKQENLTLRLESNKSKSEVTYQNDRCNRLEESILLLNNEITLISQRRIDAEKELLENQRLLRLKEDSIFQQTQTIRSLEDKIQQLQVEVEVTKLNEHRLVIQISEAKEEVKRQISLTESIQRIEAGMYMCVMSISIQCRCSISYV